MKVSKDDFNAIVNLAMESGNVNHMRPVIEKELLHYDILFCLEQNGLLDGLVFQEGTCLRLCYGGNRFSEDLDFAGGEDFSSQTLAKMKNCIEQYIGSRYDLEVRVREPATLKLDEKYAELNIDKWQISVITQPERKDLPRPRQRIKLEVANIPAHTTQTVSLNANYSFLPDGYDETLIFAETLDEIMADKLISLPATQRYVRNRDIWDLTWLTQQGATLNIGLIEQKVNDYKLQDYTGMLTKMITAIPQIVTGNTFKNEMKRFLPTDVHDRTLGKSKFEGFLINTVSGLLLDVKQRLDSDKEKPDPDFRL